MYRVLVLMLLSCAVSMADAQESAPCDIQFIAVDDLLAARGMAFMKAQSPSAVCNASRSAILDGKQTIPHDFRSNGYLGKGVGKVGMTGFNDPAPSGTSRGGN